MNSEQFMNKAKKLVEDYLTRNEEEFDAEVYIISYGWVLGFQKALIGTTLYGKIFEVTYNMEKNKIYFNAYSKVDSKCFELNH